MKFFLILLQLAVSMGVIACSQHPQAMPQRYVSTDGITELFLSEKGSVEIKQLTQLYLNFDAGRWSRSGEIIRIETLGETLKLRINQKVNETQLELINGEMCPQAVSTWNISTRYRSVSSERLPR